MERDDDPLATCFHCGSGFESLVELFEHLHADRCDGTGAD